MMATHPTEAELLRYIEGDLPFAKAERIRRMSEADQSVAQAVERVRADALLAAQLREAAGDAETLSAEKRIEAALTETTNRAVKQN